MRHHQEYEPPEALRDTIQCFWYERREFEHAPSSFQVEPDGYAEIIFHFSHLSYNTTPLPSPFLMGLLNQPVTFHIENRLEIIGVRCFPWTVADLLGLPSGKGVRIFEHPVAHLQPILQNLIQADKIAAAIRHVQQYFLETRAQVPADTMLYKAGVAMRKANGAIPVSQIAAAAHATVRTLERKFKQSSGHTVKDVTGLMRFEQVRNRLWWEPDVNIAGLAIELGYADQSHLSREFKRYSGATPAAFARKAKQAQKSAKDDFVAFIQA
ncbi:helix-turn-helix domain-containing protein [Chitinophaga sedimenti]|uniref:AraC family transcriptional regulator n=1 Tax=Chitinophaga sedimenti TaxID=2033606 RepID=UPI0020065E60|nr:helix-turn-helix domain-containing protein [Chitinophaga sedimenti]MCK7553957.1 helix-turn-helix domain-containing protein [Chitinophaga sedimenti]